MVVCVCGLLNLLGEKSLFKILVGCSALYIIGGYEGTCGVYGALNTEHG